mmetsp:Transcript_35107/g.74078  ORF Transcript_35107/g.74078 Transcript_35107/m.74078 type:complete len:303 (+) Transcript_35107:723-1631(+)
MVLLPDDDDDRPAARLPMRRPTSPPPPRPLPCLPRAEPKAEDVANGGGDVRGSRYSLAIANGIVAVGAAGGSAGDDVESDVRMLDASMLRSRLVLFGGTMPVGPADSLLPEGLLSLSSLFSSRMLPPPWVFIISTSPEAVLLPSASSDEVIVVAVRPAVTVLLLVFSLAGLGSREGCWYLSALMDEGGETPETFPSDPSSPSPSSLSSSSSSRLSRCPPSSSPFLPPMTGLFNPSGISASYNNPGISGLSSSLMRFTSALSGPHGVNTAHRSYNPSMIKSVHVEIVSKWDSCQEIMTEEHMR